MAGKTLIFIPTFNERENAPLMAREIFALGLDADLMIVDDNSPDGTGQALDEMAAEFPRLIVRHRAGRLGIGSAHLEGIAWAYEQAYDRLVTLDCDFTHLPADIPRLLELVAGYDFVAGSRFLRPHSLPGWPLWRRMMTRAGHLLTVTLLRLPSDASGSFRVYDLQRVPRELFGLVQARGYAFFFESMFILVHNGMRLQEVPIVLPSRANGTSKMSLREMYRGIARLFAVSLLSLLRPDSFSALQKRGMTEKAPLPVSPAAIVAWGAAAGLTLAIYVLHVTLLQHAGGLWRDEVVTLHMATMPTWRELWHLLPIESFPVFSHLFYRVWAAVLGPGEQVRVLGMLFGLANVAALWLSARVVGRTLPAASLLLFGLSPVCLRYGDSIRAYGPGAGLIILTFVALWLVASQPSPLRVVLAGLAVICNVQCLYQGAFFVFAACLGGVAVCLRHRQWPRALLILGLGALAALSLTPYLNSSSGQAEIKSLMETSFSWARLWEQLLDALGGANPWVPWLWALLVLTGIVASLQVQFQAGASLREKDLALYGLVCFGVAAVGFLIFLRILSFLMQAWYFVPLMALTAAFVDVALLPWLRRPAVRIAAGALVLLAGAFMLPAANRAAHTRFTNVDLIAQQLGVVARSSDFVVVMPWYCGCTFARYYHGAAPWTTNPEWEDVTTQRSDLLKAKMMSADPIGPTLSRIAKTLAGGGQVYWVGGLAMPPAGMAAPEIAPAPDPRFGWNNAAYLQTWALQTGAFLQRHAAGAELLPGSALDPISPLEEQQVLVIRGWRP